MTSYRQSMDGATQFLVFDRFQQSISRNRWKIKSLFEVINEASSGMLKWCGTVLARFQICRF